MKLTEYNREEIKKLIQDGVCGVQTLRDYDALKQLETGEKVKNVAMDNNISRKHVWALRKKYM